MDFDLKDSIWNDIFVVSIYFSIAFFTIFVLPYLLYKSQKFFQHTLYKAGFYKSKKKVSFFCFTNSAP